MPTFFVLGAAKSGTTTLHHLLGRHPDIAMCEPKEPTFFSSPFQVVANPLDYVELFDRAGDARHVGESSHCYLTDPRAPRAIRAFVPDARFVVVLRDPVERAHSLYCDQRRRGMEWAPTFEAALRLEPRRARSRRFRRRAPDALQNFLYVGSGRYDEQLARWFGEVGRERFLVLLHEELVAEPGGTVARVHRFLDLAPVDPGPAPRLNVGGSVPRWAPVSHVLTRWAFPLGGLARRVDGTVKRRTSIPDPRMHPATRMRLRRELRPSVVATAELLGVGPLWWTAPPQPSGDA